MAQFSIKHDRLTVTLRWWEKLAARRSHLTIPLRAIRGVSCVADPLTELGVGQRHGATHIPGWTYTGTMSQDPGGRVLAVCHRKGPGIVLELADATYSKIVISTPHASEYAQKLQKIVA
ncbi:hypothetical protein QP027_01040 [Corynebacterium breve]|uniref:Bacterial Pleckstrin homology domain-containing protein n=1 Tax=Corynebacterium breve TaxID=3049799 RepID=A0ABY8VGB9_9CORY|nr:hypothetical protein [Corynebacterium breve]WIM68016.1 hypothetical protein QP027_01040 [Corynebacterium breve]